MNEAGSRDAEKALRLLHTVDFEEPIQLSENSTARLLPAGHILGASMIMVESAGKRVLFSGDLGRPNDPVMRPPSAVEQADVLVLESTYGDRRHSHENPEAELSAHLSRALGRGGVVVFPAFAVGRVQTLLYLLARLKRQGSLKGVPVYLNSPMATDVTRLYQTYWKEHRLSAEDYRAACQVAEFVNSPDDSKALNEKRGPMIIISASGMATGGRVVHHLRAFAPDPRNMVLFTGFQAGGTRGAAMVAGAKSIRIHG